MIFKKYKMHVPEITNVARFICKTINISRLVSCYAQNVLIEPPRNSAASPAGQSHKQSKLHRTCKCKILAWKMFLFLQVLHFLVLQ